MIKLAVICPSEIALRRFMPAIKRSKEFQYVGVGVCREQEIVGASAYDIEQHMKRQRDKAERFVTEYGGVIFDGYHSVVTSADVDAVYLPLPPALHYKWARIALENNKHVFIEKPTTLHEKDTKELIRLASDKGLAVHENYMFIFHKQLEEIHDIVLRGEIGDVRLCRISFGFPLRPLNDFRYSKELGGGAFNDAGGYVMKYATMLLGETAQIVYANMKGAEGFEVDMYGSGALVNEDGATVQISYGMDNQYKCDLEIWGSKGSLYTGRVFTAPEGYVPEVTLFKGSECEHYKLSSDDTFGKAIQHFYNCIKCPEKREQNYQQISKLSEYLEEFQRMGRAKIQ